MLRRHLALSADGERLLGGLQDRQVLSARGLHRLLRVARTAADLDGSAAHVRATRLDRARAACGGRCGAAASDMSACRACLRRAWLLGALNGRLEYAGRDPERLVGAAGARRTSELMRAVGGVRGRAAAEALRRARFPSVCRRRQASSVICRHDPSFPAALREGRGRAAAAARRGGPRAPARSCWMSRRSRSWVRARRATTGWRSRTASRGAWRRAGSPW